MLERTREEHDFYLCRRLRLCRPERVSDREDIFFHHERYQ